MTSEDLELRVLQAVRLKGRTTPDALADTVDATVTDAVAALSGDGLLATGRAIKLTEAGRERLSALLARERDGVDRDAIAAAYAAFRVVNADFKSVVSDWQLMDGQPNPHDDTDGRNADHDNAVLARLHQVHAAAVPIIDAAAAHVPRIASYGTKLNLAMERIDAGDHAWVARPIIDSYHTVWFELHEELIGLAGRNRADEAEAGHA